MCQITRVLPKHACPGPATGCGSPKAKFHRKVLLARAQFAVTGPAWAQPLPVGDEITPLLKATGAMYLLGAYSCSLIMLGYNFQVHPSFYDYGCGVMNHPRAPEHVRGDPELQAEFPARELPGFCGRLVWFGENLPRLTSA